MSKKDRASSARRKRAADPQADRPGTGNTPIMVKTDKEKKKKVKESVNEAIDFFKASKDLTDYAKKHGGIDKRDFEQAGAFVREIGKELFFKGSRQSIHATEKAHSKARYRCT